MTEELKKYYSSLEDNFFGWWIKNFRITVMLIILLIGYGLYAAFSIPKESSPEIKFGIVSVSTVYVGANPIDIDQLITTKLEEKIKALEGIDKIDSTSSVGFSNIVITLKNETDVKDFITDVKNEVGKVTLPTDVKTPTVTEISTSNELLFEIMVYGDAKQFSMNHLRSLAGEMADNLRGQGPIVDVKLGSAGGGGSSVGSAGGGINLYNIEVLLDEKKMQSLGLTLGQVTQAIRNFNSNIPLGSHDLGSLQYDYRIKGKLSSLNDLMNVPIGLSSNENGPKQYTRLSDIAIIQRNYSDDSIQYGGIYKDGDNVATTMIIYKGKRSNIFENASKAKELIQKEISKPIYKDLKVEYTRDLLEIIIDDYASLAGNAWQAVLLIFLVTWLFIGFKQSLIATLSMPLAFFITFIFLDWQGYTLNFLTNFSLILTFGMGIDTVIVIIEAGYELMKKGYNSKTATLLAMKQYAKPNITSSLANMIVFLPMLALPGITGKFLAYIPITIFVTLAGSLFLASSVNSAIFRKLNNNQKYYYKPKPYTDGDDEEILLSDMDQKLLALEQQGKEARESEAQPITDRFIDRIAHRYVTKLHGVITNKAWRRASFIGPVVALVLSFVFLSGSIGFKLFPSGDNPFIDISITTVQGTNTQTIAPLITPIHQVISHIPELKNFNLKADGNTIDIGVTLVNREDRDRDSFMIQDEILEKLGYLKEEGYKVESKVQAGGPPAGKAVGIQLISDDTNKLNELKSVSADFENYLRSLTGTTNITNSSKNNPGQFEFTRDNTKLAQLGLTPADFQGELLSAMLGQNAGTLLLEKKDRDIIVKYKGFSDNAPNNNQSLSPETILSTVFNTRVGPVILGSVAEYSVNQSLSSLARNDGDISIKVETDLEQGKVPTDYQPKLLEYASNYQFPSGISYKAGGENEENAELIQAAGVAFVIAIFLTFLILVYQFNSFKQPTIILYSIVTALLGVNIGLRVTGNPYSMPFMIGFISLIGIVVNNAIFIIDKINNNLKLGIPLLESILDAGKTRFKPVVISSLTTILGIISLARKDEFWAGLAWTVVFGLLFSSFMTLLSLPNIYYSVYKPKDGSSKSAQ